MDSDDEFGDLYSDVLAPLTGISVNPDPNPNPNPNFTAPSVPIPSQSPNSNSSSKHALDSLIGGEPNEDWMPDNWDEEDNYSGIKTTIEPEVKGNIETPGIINSKDWDSDDSEDDLNIVLNDDSGMGMGVGEIMEDDKDNLANFDNNDYNQEGNDGYLDKEEDDMEKKEGLDTLKGNDAVRCGFGNFQQHQQQHSMFKYVRPGAPAVGPNVQIRPPGQPVVPFAGRGRGDWRPSFGQKSFGWANNNASRPFGGGLDFTLPSYKTIFEVDIEVFEEKTWRNPGVDISDYFNFGLDEENWKEYAKQLDQLRMQSTMQSKIRVYESGRSVQEYDPDLPPELAAAANHHDISADNMNPGKIYNVQSDLNGQGKGSPDTQALPVGRPIQVEMSNIERMASMDTRPPRPRYPDVIIEVFSCDHLEDDAPCDDASENPEKDLQGEKHNGTEITEVDGHNDSEHYSRSPQNIDDHTRENFEVRHRENESLRVHHKGRSTEEPFSRRNRSAKEHDHRKEKTENISEPKKSPKQSVSTSETDKREPSAEQNDNKVEGTAAMKDDNDTEDNGTSDSITRPSRKPKLSSQVAPPIKDDPNNDNDVAIHKPIENSLQNGRWRRNDSTRRQTNDHVKEPRHVMMDRKRINSRAYDPYTNRVWEQPYPSRPVRAFERMRNVVDDSVRNKDVSSRARERKDKPEKGENSRRKMEKDKAEDHYYTNRRERGIKDGQRVENTHDDHKSRRAAEKDGKKIVDKRERKVDESFHEKKKYSSDERSSKVHNGRSSVSDSQKVYKDGKRESTRKNTDSDAGVQYSSGHGKRKREDSTHRNEKLSTKRINEQEKHDNDDTEYKDETERESKRGRSKLERWSSDIKEVDAVADDEVILSTNETQQAHHDITATNQDSHLDNDTVEKLKRRSMRFKTPLPSEKDLSSKTSSENNQLQLDSGKARAEDDVKLERPARKRKWSSSN